MNHNVYSTNRATVEIYGPGDEAERLDREVVEEKLSDADYSDEPLAQSDDAYLEFARISDGVLEIGAWTGNENGDGWFVYVGIPLLATDSLRGLIGELAGRFGIGGSDDVLGTFREIVRRDVDDQGRVSVGRNRAGKTVKLGIIEEED